MIVVADSGSTKTEWRLCTREKVVAYTKTHGLNPLALDSETAIATLRTTALSEWLQEPIEEVYFYGAGLVNEKLKTVVNDILSPLFTAAKITAESDLLGAARAIFGQQEGIVGILGTGSNSGFYDGKEIARNIPALGYILGDEGSGATLGRTLIKHFLRNELPDSISEAFRKRYPNYANLVLDVYSKEHASRFLASFVPFIYEHKEEDFIKTIVLQELNKFVELLSKYDKYAKVGLVGSVGFLFQTELNLLARSADLNIVDYVKDPIDKLTEYHQIKAP